ncbi:DUF2911 domain-containing protein [Aureibacter tunicatorum]|uniref:DUF2911 domain-containing protein n=1 Tax=Aureibacter tunicatorum TaxID=866807 RepID=A0AAE4BUK3_9BACT|nr:DUF2911 domain-containing protein [Aureibacter tunicatorum]MDR6241165.1 hypothetical protein [Aureibacter tunicatorum]BDD03940.1 hypothetical protein AUTU_14230 [Aureibacter tunicatorum]
MKTIIAFLLLLITAFQPAYSQIGRLAPSPLQETKIKIGVTDITLSFSRPSMRGREIFGGLVPYNQWWRTGANRNTTIEFSEEITIGEQRIKKGKYAIFSKPNPDKWEILLYKKTDNWNVPKTIDSTQIAASITVPVKTIADTLEVMSISIDNFTNYEFDLSIAWSTSKVTIPVQLITREIMEEKISSTLNGPSFHDYYAAAVYEMESGHNFNRGLEWIELSIKHRETPSWWDLRAKAILLMGLNKNEEALKVAQKANSMAIEENHDFGIVEMKRIIKELHDASNFGS